KPADGARVAEASDRELEGLGKPTIGQALASHSAALCKQVGKSGRSPAGGGSSSPHVCQPSRGLRANSSGRGPPKARRASSGEARKARRRVRHVSPFSKSGYWASGDAMRLQDSRSDTLTAYLRVLRDTQPKVFLLENVYGLAYKGKSEGLDRILTGVGKINRQTGSRYRPVWQVIDAASYGVPQHRERVFIVASRDGKQFKFPTVTHGKRHDLLLGCNLEPYRTAWDALGDLPERLND